MSNVRTKKGFTIVELIITVAVFSVFLTAIVTFMVDMYRTSRRVELEEQIYQDMRALMRQITLFVESNAIDYEEYFRASLPGVPQFAGKDNPAYTYGDYAKRFYNFGSDSAPGALCNTGIAVKPGCVIDKTTLDRNMGQNPPDGNPEDGNAFCGAGMSADPCPVDKTSLHEQAALYLINEDGNRKTFLALEPVNRDIGGTTVVENSLSILWMNGSDTDGDDVVDTWTTSQEFVAGTPKEIVYDLINPKDESEIYNNFIPISPLRSNIVDLKFYVSPLEDPYKAFAEIDPLTGTLVQPHITVVMTMEPSAVELQDYLGPVPSKTLQTTIYSDVKQSIRSY